MDMKNFRRCVLSFVLLLLVVMSAGCMGTAAPADKAGEQIAYHITVLHTNDHHGRFWKNARGEYGMAARKTLIDQIRSEVESTGGFVLVLSAGDINTGVPESSLLKAEPDIKAMNLLGYDAMAVGNHEFDNPLPILRTQQSWMEFPLLSANIFDKKTGQALFDAYEIFNFKGLKIGVVGLITLDTATQGNPDNIAGLIFTDPVQAARSLAAQLKNKTDVLIALTHLGHYADGRHGANAPGSVTLARSVPGIDLIVDGHTHEKLEQPDVQNQTLIVQAGEYGKYLGRLDLVYFNGKIVQKAYRLIPVNLKKKIKKNGKTARVHIEAEIPEDPEVLEMLGEYQKVGADELNVVIGSSRHALTGDQKIIRNFKSPICELVCNAYMKKTGADLAIVNSGGIRAGLPKGEITYKHVLKVSPFGNTLCTVELTGGELIAYLEKAVAMKKETGAFAQLSGVTVRVHENKVVSAFVNNAPVIDKDIYKLVVPSYMAAGGDAYPSLTDHPRFIDTGFLDADVLREYISNHSPLDEP